MCRTPTQLVHDVSQDVDDLNRPVVTGRNLGGGLDDRRFGGEIGEAGGVEGVVVRGDHPSLGCTHVVGKSTGVWFFDPAGRMPSMVPAVSFMICHMFVRPKVSTPVYPQ